MFKFDDPQQSCLQQHHRKDSTSSEVAAFLCISGRTSRISSVGSQGSAASRLSAISGVSRSPSPHRMLLETSFCGPKPLDNNLAGGLVSNIESPASELLEQVLLARKHDPTQAILAEGIKIDTSVNSPQKSNVGNGDGPIKRKSLELSQKMPEVKITKPTGTAIRQVRKPIGKKEVVKPILGVNPSGTEYYRIKLKPDHMYKDNGLGENEKIIDPTVEVRKKPGTLNLKGQTDDQITRHPDQKLVPSASPKPARHIALSRDLGSRSPSPATVTVSRKSSFCSLFKSKDTIASPESPRDRSRSKSREGGTSQTGTPSKQKSVLAIFKPKKTGSKSKSTSPIEPDNSSGADSLSQVEFRFESSQSCVNDSRSRSRQRLRYYDTPLDGKSIHIPLHTPPDEKDDFKLTNQTTATAAPPSQPTSFKQTVPIEISNIKPINDKPKPKNQSVQKSYRIENPDGSITIPLHSPTEEREIDVWSKDVQRHSSQESQETVISSHIASTDENALSKMRIISKINLNEQTDTQPLKSPTQQQQKNEAPITQSIIQPAPPPPTPIQTQPSTATTRDKKHILFCTRIGSGSEEQIFSTQFSLSKTESLNSQLSEHTSVFDSPTGSEIKENGLQRNDTVIKRDEPIQSVVILRKKNSFDESKRKSKVTEPITLQQELSAAVEIAQGKLAKEEVINCNRHSRYIENIDEIMEEQRKLQENLNKQKELRKSDDELSPPTTSQEELHKPDPIIEIPKTISPIPVSPHPPPLPDRNSMASSDYLGSSESERESETDSTRVKRHLPRNMGTIDDHESTGLVSQDSYDDELPYVPTTLPEERTIGIALVPIKERAYMDLKMCPVERPRSTTPINPSSLEEYCGTILTDDNDNLPIRGEKLRISLPRRDSKDRLPKSSKSPRRISNASGKSWFEFAEHGIKGTAQQQALPSADESCRRGSGQEEDPPPPPLPPRKPSTTNQWINFEDIPEKRKPPKRITLLPGKENSTPTQEIQPHHVQYNYVNPDECSCECHESEREISNTRIENNVEPETEQAPSEDTEPLLEPDLGDCIDRTSIIR